MPRKSRFLALVFLIGMALTAHAQDLGAGQAPADRQNPVANAALAAGMDAFAAERYGEALDRFASVLSDPKSLELRPSAAYWSILAYLALGDQAAAEKAIDDYLAAYPEGERLPDLLYQKARILFSKGDFETALTTFSSFVNVAPAHSLVPSALYWGGECLYALGRLEDADKVFKGVIEKYPTSVKVEAAKYKRDLIALEFRERELLKLLSWSHEESLKAADDFRSREKNYEQAISAYQKQIAEVKASMAARTAENPDLKNQVSALQAKLQAAQAELDSARADLAKAQTQAATTAASAAAAAAAPPVVQAAPTAGSQQAELLSAGLDAKRRALDLLGFYLDKLSQGVNK
jgi:TolA-binding protein